MADKDRRRFSLRNISFRKAKKVSARPQSISDASLSQSRSTGVRSSSEIRSASTTSRPKSLVNTGERAPSRIKKSPASGSWNPNSAWNKPLIGQAVQPFTAILRCDLTFEVGDKIVILTRTEKQFDWWEGTVRGQTGIFPANYILVLE
ncbi:uncharacterized protein [Diadema setosum]|uniref:uncharacterized protein n=1 Tax=Diadema setosum TaxID=31175 RepID=UPI003B3AE2F1